MNSVYLLIGSNIDPVQNIQKALALLQGMVNCIEVSRAWETPSYGSPGPNFINLAAHILTDCNRKQLKEKVIAKIEHDLRRVRTSNKNAPRTIDVDLIIFNDDLLENAVWERPHILLPMAELVPELKRPVDNRKLYEISQKIQTSTTAILRSDLKFG